MDGCDVDTRKHFRVVAYILVVGIILSVLGTVISIMTMMNVLSGVKIFNFSHVVDPPYLGILCMVLLILLISMTFSLRKIRGKVCKSVDVPFI